MDCEVFHLWLEKRDLYDLSEADRALRHSEECDRCKVLLVGDRQLDKRLRELFKYRPTSETLLRHVDKSIEYPVKKRQRFNKFLAIPALIVISLALFFVLQPSKNVAAIEALGRSVVFDHLNHGNLNTRFEKIVNMSQWSCKRLQKPFVIEGLPKNDYTVVGGIICTINGCDFAHVLLDGGNGYVSLFVASEQDIHCKLVTGKIYNLRIEGQNVRLWKRRAMVYILVA